MSKVALAKCPEYRVDRVRQALEEALAPLGGLEKHIKPGMRVLLKPNFVKGCPAPAAVNTHPVFIEAVARMVLDLGARPTIGDSPSVFSAQSAARACGVDEVAKRLGIPMINLGRPVEVPSLLEPGNPPVRLSADALEFDAILNLPKLKCHCQMYMTVATKNLFGLVPGQRKFIWHAKLGEAPELFAKMLVNVAHAAKPALHLVDAVVGLERGGPIHGDPRELGFVIAGEDCAAVDRVAVESVGADPEKMLTLRAAAELGIGEPSLERIEIAGEPLSDIAVRDFVKTAQVKPLMIRPRQIPAILARNIYNRFVRGASAS